MPPEPIINRTTTELATIELDQDDIELALAFWLMNTHPDAFRHTEFKFDWHINQIASVTVSGVRVRTHV